MYQLSEEETNIIYERLQGEGLKSAKLEQDLFDHFCCHVEAQMGQGASFEDAYLNAVKDIYPNGAKEIEFELFFIINFNKQLSMKRFIFLSGFIAVLLFSTATMFKTLHWPAANILLVTGFAMMLLTIAAAIIYLAMFVRHKSRAFRFRTVAGLLTVAFLSAGYVFKIFHFTGANVLYSLGIITLNFAFLPFFFYYLYKHGFAKTTVNEKA